MSADDGHIIKERKYGLHDKSCISAPKKIIKPTPYAGKRAWKNYRKLLKGE